MVTKVLPLFIALLVLLCGVSGVQTQIECSTEATHGGGSVVSSGDTVSGHVGQSYTLKCSCQNVNQPVTYAWKKSNVSISGETESTLALSQIKLSDAGRYSCSIMLNGVAYSSNIDVTIQIPAPSYVMVRSDKPNPIRPIGSNVTLTCMVGLHQSPIGTTVPLTLTVMIIDPAGNALSNNMNSVSGSTYTSRAVIGSALSGVYTCEATITSPSLYLSESSTVTEEIHLTSGVYLSLGSGIGIQNNTCASISDIGSSQPNQLACITDRKPCCLSQGQWYYPNGSQIGINSAQNSLFYMERTNEGSVNLFRPSNVLEPHGEFCCKIADAMDVDHTLCIDLVPSISILIDDNGTNPVAGLNYSLSCEVSGIDTNTTTLSYEWKKDDTLLSKTDPLLSFSPFRLSHAGHYSCTINMHGCPFKYSMDLSKIEVTSDAVSLTLISDPKSQLGRIYGSRVNVTCTAELSPAIDVLVTVQIQLTDPTGRLLANETFNNTSSSTYSSEGIISSFRSEHNGIYMCSVTLTALELQRNITKSDTIHIYSGVHLLFKGKIYSNNSFFFISEIGRLKSSSALQCVSGKEICCKKYKIGEWYFPDERRVPIEGDATTLYRNRADNGTVNLNQFDNVMSPIGEYCCHVPNATDVLQTLCVNTLAVSVSGDIAPPMATRNYNNTLNCTVSEAKSLQRKIAYQWFKDVTGTRVQVGSNTSTLLLPHVLKVSNAGHYTCQVSMMRESKSSRVLATAEASWEVRVQIPPSIELIMTSDPSIASPIQPIGTSISLNCSCDIAQTLPVEYVDILDITVNISLRDPLMELLPTTAISVSGTVYTTSAVISSFGRNQSGIYTCTAFVNSPVSFIIGREISTQKHITTGVYLSFEGSVPPHDIMILVTDIGISSPNQLVCVSDRKPCCQDQPQYGGWYYPNRSRVAHILERPVPTAFHSDRNNHGEINLYRTSTDINFPVGQFCCETMDAENTNHTLCVTVAPPIIANITTEGTATVGQTYTLVCSVLSGLEGLNAVVSYQWTKDNGTRSQLGANANMLSILSLRLSDAGSYTCEISVNSSRLLKQAAVRTTIQVKVSITRPNIDLISSAPNPILSGSSPTLLCIVQLHPAVDIPVNLSFVWISPDDSTMRQTSNVMKSFSLYTSKVVLSDISLADAGQYTCKVSIGSEAIGSDVSVFTQRDVQIGDGMFQLRMKYTDDCRVWYKSSSGEMEVYKHFIEEALIEAIKLRCECHFPRENLLQESFSCSSSPHLTTYRNTLIGTHNVNASQLVGFIQDWVKSEPKITIKSNYSVWVDKKCPVAVSSFDEPECGGE